MSRKPQTFLEHASEVHFLTVDFGDHPRERAIEIIHWMEEVGIDPEETNLIAIARSFQASPMICVRIDRSVDAVMFKLRYSEIVRAH